jgi:hypothetical protein
MLQGQPVRLYGRPGSLVGTVETLSCDVAWRSASNYRLPPGAPVVAELAGAWSGAVEVAARCWLEPTYLFDRASIEGVVGGDAVSATAKRVRGSSTNNVRVSGTWGDTEFAVVGVVGHSHTGEPFPGRVESTGSIRARVGGHRIHMDLRCGERAAEVEGAFAGPSAMALIMVFAMLHFTGALFRFGAPMPTPTGEVESDPSFRRGQAGLMVGIRYCDLFTGVPAVTPTEGTDWNSRRPVRPRPSPVARTSSPVATRRTSRRRGSPRVRPAHWR